MAKNENSKGVNVQVILRCRPGSEEEVKTNVPQVITCNEGRKEVSVYQNNLTSSKVTDRTFTFDKVFGPSSKQKDLYDEAITPIVNEVLDGFNCTIFAYGQTGTGKTYTMEGAGRRQQDIGLPSGAGVIPRAVQQIFDTLESALSEYTVKVTFLELYNEELTDLLAPEELKQPNEEKQKKPLVLMEDNKGGGVVVRGLEEEIVGTASEIYSLLERGSAKRRTAETLLNKQSSRSHSIFTITIHMKEMTTIGEELIKVGKLNLVDLAGSENISRSGARDGRAREAGEINKSLLTLGRVITALVEHLGHTPYRDSKLTRLLRDSLGGRTKTCIIATVSPSVHCLEETLSTLDYAHRAKSIKNKPELNQKTTKTVLMKDMAGEIERLRAELYAQREKSGVYVPREKYFADEEEHKAVVQRVELQNEELDRVKKRLEAEEEKHGMLQQDYDELQVRQCRTQRSLSDTRQELQSTQTHLKTTQHLLAEKEYLVGRLQQSESSLVKHASLLRNELERSVEEVAGLTEKIESMEETEEANCSAGAAMRDHLEGELRRMAGTVNATVGNHADQTSAVCAQLEMLLQRKTKELCDVECEVEQLRLLLTKEGDAAAQLVQHHTGQAVTALQEMASDQTTHSAQMQQTVALVCQTAENSLVQMRQIFDNVQLAVAAFAHHQRESAHESLSVATNLSASVQTAFSTISSKMEASAAQHKQQHAEQNDTIEALAASLQNNLRCSQKEMLEGVQAMMFSACATHEKLVNTEVSSLRSLLSSSSAALQTDFSEARSVADSGHQQVADYKKSCEDAVGSQLGAVAAKHCHLEGLFHQLTDAHEGTRGELASMKATMVGMSNKHSEQMTAAFIDQAQVAAQFAGQVEERRAASQQEAEQTHSHLAASLEDSMAADQVGIAKVRTALESTHCGIVEFESAHKGHATACVDRVHHFVDEELQRDTMVGPKPREGEVPPVESIHKLATGALHDVILAYHDNNLCPESCQRVSHTCRDFEEVQ